ncbi:GDSL esterase/lipase 1-like protein [Corchorus olitorius]|uniref:GDSL esterase/lipase 1-like protein n=1 Tax=Corchorus olitorius TaxID=93759 RepID=A0A1R3H6J7_9ROSI|nr:GDSL esterase/lipase 1-like protein [Corchorus olitorius]
METGYCPDCKETGYYPDDCKENGIGHFVLVDERPSEQNKRKRHAPPSPNYQYKIENLEIKYTDLAEEEPELQPYAFVCAKGHLTDRANGQFAEEIWSGSHKITGPYNLKELFEG